MNEAKTLLRSMEVLDIRQLIGEATEYDKKVALEVKKPKSWCKSVSAFANGMGGRTGCPDLLRQIWTITPFIS